MNFEPTRKCCCLWCLPRASQNTSSFIYNSYTFLTPWFFLSTLLDPLFHYIQHFFLSGLCCPAHASFLHRFSMVSVWISIQLFRMPFKRLHFMQTSISNHEFQIRNMKTALKLAVCCTSYTSIITSPGDNFILLSKQSWSVYCLVYFFCRISRFIVFIFPCPHITLSFHHSPMKDFKPLLTFPTVSDGAATQTRVRIDGQWAGWSGCLPAPLYSPSTSGLLPHCLSRPYPILWHCIPEL